MASVACHEDGTTPWPETRDHLGPRRMRRQKVVAAGQRCGQEVSNPSSGLWEVGAGRRAVPALWAGPALHDVTSRRPRGRGLSTGRRFPQPFVACRVGRAGVSGREGVAGGAVRLLQRLVEKS